MIWCIIFPPTKKDILIFTECSKFEELKWNCKSNSNLNISKTNIWAFSFISIPTEYLTELFVSYYIKNYPCIPSISRGDCQGHNMYIIVLFSFRSQMFSFLSFPAVYMKKPRAIHCYR